MQPSEISARACAKCKHGKTTCSSYHPKPQDYICKRPVSSVSVVRGVTLDPINRRCIFERANPPDTIIGAIVNFFLPQNRCGYEGKYWEQK